MSFNDVIVLMYISSHVLTHAYSVYTVNFT